MYLLALAVIILIEEFEAIISYVTEGVQNLRVSAEHAIN